MGRTLLSAKESGFVSGRGFSRTGKCAPPLARPDWVPRSLPILQGAGERVSPDWQPRFYDFNVWTERKRAEKLDYIHDNPVRRGLVAVPGEWRWSSYRSYAFGEPGLVRINDCDIMKMTVRTSVA